MPSEVAKQSKLHFFQCAGCNTYLPWAAVVVGALGGCAFYAVHIAMLKVCC